MVCQEDDPTLANLELVHKDLKNLLHSSMALDKNLKKMDKRFNLIDQSLSTSSRRIAPLQTISMANRALDTRINRAVNPALSLLHSFRLFESLQDQLLHISDELSGETSPKKRLRKLLKYVDCVDHLNSVVRSISNDGEPTIQKLQEVVEFLSRTKATDQFRAHRLRETLVTLKALFEKEVDAMRFEGLLDEALLQLQEEYEVLLQQLKHEYIGKEREDDGSDVGADGDGDGDGDGKGKGNGNRDGDGDGEGGQVDVGPRLGSKQAVEVLKRISETLEANDCLDICIDIYVKVRYRRAAKALMRLNPDYLRTYTTEEIDEMEWETLETAITLWIQHFGLAVKAVFVSEKKLCNRVLGRLMDGLVWPECFVKIADKIMAVFFRFGEGVARSKKEPQKLFKLLDMFDSLESIKPDFPRIFEGEPSSDIRTRFRELEKLLVHASSRVFWEFGLQIEGNSDGFPPPQDGSVPKLVRYAVNYLKYLVTENYSSPMAKVLRTEQVWKAGVPSKPESNEDLLRDAVANVMEALQRNVESKRGRYRDRILPHVFTMNTYWYIYMRTRNTELGKLLGDQYMKKQYKVVAEESAYMYRKLAWGSLVRLLEVKDESKRAGNGTNNNKEGLSSVAVIARMEGFLKGLEEMLQKHRSLYVIPEADLREQIKEATVKLVVGAYGEFLKLHGAVLVLEEGSYTSVESMEGLMSKVFDQDGNSRALKRRDSKERRPGDGEWNKDFRLSRSDDLV